MAMRKIGSRTLTVTHIIPINSPLIQYSCSTNYLENYTIISKYTYPAVPCPTSYWLYPLENPPKFPMTIRRKKNVDEHGRTLGCARSLIEPGLLKGMCLKKNYSQVVLLTTKYYPTKNKNFLFSFSLIPHVPSPSLHRTFLFFFPDLISFSSSVVFF